MAAEEQAAELLERASDLSRRAYSGEALELLEGCGTWPVPYNERGLLLRANILIATRDPIAALDELPEDAQAFTTHEGRVEYFLASAWAYIGTRNWRAADGMLSAAFVNYAGGRVQHAQGNLNLAVRSLENAYDIFASLEYEFRALLAARALFQITGQERWLQSARLHAAAYPNHILSRRLFEAPLLRRE